MYYKAHYSMVIMEYVQQVTSVLLWTAKTAFWVTLAPFMAISMFFYLMWVTGKLDSAFMYQTFTMLGTVSPAEWSAGSPQLILAGQIMMSIVLVYRLLTAPYFVETFEDYCLPRLANIFHKGTTTLATFYFNASQNMRKAIDAVFYILATFVLAFMISVIKTGTEKPHELFPSIKSTQKIPEYDRATIIVGGQARSGVIKIESVQQNRYVIEFESPK